MVLSQFQIDKEAIDAFLAEYGAQVEIIFKVFLIIVAWILFGFLLRRIRIKLTPTQHNALKTLGRATILLFGILFLAMLFLFLVLFF